MVANDDALAGSPPELIARVAEQAARDADMTVHFLEAIGLGSPPGEVRRFPARFLFELGAAMRLLAWEEEGLQFRAPGLPTAAEAIRRAFQDLNSSTTSLSTLPFYYTVHRISVERLAWAGPRDLQAEVLLDAPEEDALVEAMARFLWDHRGASRARVGGETS